MTLMLLTRDLTVLALLSSVVLASPKCKPKKVGVELQKQDYYECLIENLLNPSRYSPLVRPVANISDTIKIEFSVALSQIINVDEKNQIMKTNVWLQMYWKDYQMKWDPEDYDGISLLHITPDKAWTPDIVLFNNADGNYEVSYRSNVLIQPDGTIYWVPPAIYKSSCAIDVEYFPFDEQSCEMKFGSWTFRSDQLGFEFYKYVSHLDMTDYLQSGSWDIVNGQGNITSYKTGVSDESKAMVIFTIKLRRKTLFYTVNLIIPCVLISFVTVCVFLQPADSGEKITLCISILLSLVVFLLLISKILPPALTIPLVAKYLLFAFIMNILAIMFTVLVINRNYRTPRTHHLPNWIRVVFLNYLPRLLLMRRPDHDSRWRDKTKKKKDGPVQSAPVAPVVYNRNPDLTHNARTPQRMVSEENYIESHHPNCNIHNPSSSPQTGEQGERETTFIDSQIVAIAPEIIRAAESLQFIARHLRKEDEYNAVLEDWKFVARVIDRLLLYIFLLTTVGGTVGILTSAPFIFESVDEGEIISEMNRAWDAVKSK